MNENTFCFLFFLLIQCLSMIFYREVDQVAVRKLSEGLLQIYHPKLKSIKSELSELTKKQEVLCEELHAENLKFSEAHSSVDLQEIFAKIKIYKEKLVYIKKTMLALHEQSTKLKVKKKLHPFFL